jgi:hypothetical protein
MQTELQIGDVFMKTMVSIGDGGMTRTRIIKPIMGNAMVRFDIDINVFRQSIEVHNIFFYKRGDKSAEAKAIEGDNA